MRIAFQMSLTVALPEIHCERLKHQLQSVDLSVDPSVAFKDSVAGWEMFHTTPLLLDGVVKSLTRLAIQNENFQCINLIVSTMQCW